MKAIILFVISVMNYNIKKINKIPSFPQNNNHLITMITPIHQSAVDNSQQIMLLPNLVLKQVSQDQVSCMCSARRVGPYDHLKLALAERSDLCQTIMNKRVFSNRANVNS
jgi:hypothetical protein